VKVEPITLCGRYVRLEPMTSDHAGPLARAGLFPELWRLQPSLLATADDMRAYVQTALDDQAKGMSLPFVIVEEPSGEVIGSTRYMEIAPRHRRLEIGATWITPSRQRSGANTEAKLLLLTHAFEALSAIRVVFKTEALNLQSRRALARIGAVEEGMFRQHLVADSGRRRDMVYFAILDSEWPSVKARLRSLLK
jgi:RimJ/RimL family protein N-acetyltransferase